MSRTKKKYANGQKRGEGSASATSSKAPQTRIPKDYGRIMVAYHGGDKAHETYVQNGRMGY